MSYHDDEWGVPEYDDQELFERLILEGMQAGLSWITILRKRERMRKRFYDFDIDRLARAGERQVGSWLKDAGLIRHRGKLEAMIGNAKLARNNPEPDQDFSEMLWSFAPTKKNRGSDVPSETAESQAMSKALKKAGYRFVGPTICYAFMQSVGMVNDHAPKCHRHKPVEHLRLKRAK